MNGRRIQSADGFTARPVVLVSHGRRRAPALSFRGVVWLLLIPLVIAVWVGVIRAVLTLF